MEENMQRSILDIDSSTDCVEGSSTIDVDMQNEVLVSMIVNSLNEAYGMYNDHAFRAVIPNIYSSMEDRSQFPTVLLTSCYDGIHYVRRGTKSQFTLNMPKDLVASKIAVWTTVVNPFTKFALTMSPVGKSLEELIPSRHPRLQMYSILIRTWMVISTLLVALSVPFFSLVSALIGSLLTMLVSLILPCACYLRILGGRVDILQRSMCVFFIGVGIVASALGAYSALSKIDESLK